MSRHVVVAGLMVISVVAGTVACDTARAQQHRPTADSGLDRGREMFMAQGCHGCHMVGKLGSPIGPDLSHVGAKYSEAYLKKWLRDPQQVRPAAHMPMLELTDSQIAVLAAFLASLH